MSEFLPFGMQLRKLRTAAGMSLSELAELVHYSKGHLSKVETGLASAGSALAQLCDQALGAGGLLRALAEEEFPGSDFGPGPHLVPGARAGTGARARRVPASLPRDTSHFVGRADELARLEALVLHADPGAANSSVVCMVHGMAGVGKTALVLHTAHRLHPYFPGGSLFIDLHGFTRNTQPVTPGEALDRFLRRLGVPGEAVPLHWEDRAALLREVLANRRLLLVLDNARDTEQILPLLPNHPDCPVLVTSRRRFAALDDAWHIRLDTLPSEAAEQLFTRVAGLPSPAEPSVPESRVGRIVELCGRLPLAVRIAATRCGHEAVRTLADLEYRLADEHSRLAELEDGERSVAAAFRVSFDALPQRDQHLFAVLALHPAGDLGLAAVAAMADLEPAAAEAALNRLADTHLVVRTSPGRFRLHDLLRAYSREIGDTVLTEPQRDSAVLLMLEHYVAVADSASVVLAPHRYRLPLGLPPRRTAIAVPGDHDLAVTWFAAEQRNLVALLETAAGAGSDALCWQLAYLLRDYFFLTKQWDAWITTHRQALAATLRCADRRAEATTRNNLGLALIECGELAEASRQYEQARELFRAVGDPHGEANSLGNHAWIHFYRSEYVDALAELQQAFEYYTSVGSQRNAAITLRGIGLTEMELSRFTDAVRHLEQALDSLLALDLRLDATMALNCLGEAVVRSGDPIRAVSYLERALSMGRSCGSRYEQARAYEGLGAAAAARGDYPGARTHWARALDLYRELSAARATDVAARLAGVSPGP